MKKTLLILPVSFILFTNGLHAQYQKSMADTCHLKIGMNLSDLSNYGTQQPFVDLMKTSFYWKINICISTAIRCLYLKSSILCCSGK